MDQQLIVRNNEQPIIVFQNMSDDQFKHVMTLFQPKVPTKMSIMADRKKMSTIGKIAAHFDACVCANRNSVFIDQMIANNLDNTVLELTRQNRFSINEWFYENRAKAPTKNVDNLYEIQSLGKSMTTDWINKLVELELAHSGIVDIIANCINMDVELQKQRAAAYSTSLLTWDIPQPQEMPPPAVMSTPVFELKSSHYLGSI